MESFKKAYKEKFFGTDESSIVQFAGYPVRIIEGERTNIKVTTKEDLQFNRLFKYLY
jgi:2-C-methyl-D-erythritol 4-phosphate cytidylyltransferase